MSASSKKKLRSENASAKMTERQIAEQKEAKKLKIYTIAFVAVLIVMIAVAVYTGIANYIASSGIHEKNTIAATVGDHEISNAELSYYYMDALNNFNSTYGDYAYLYGIDTSTALDQQIIDEETGETWADLLMEQALNTAAQTYAIYDEAMENAPDTSEFGTWVPGIPVLVENGLNAVSCADWLQSLILDGIVAGVGAVLGFVPQMLVLFLMLAFLRLHGPDRLCDGPDLPPLRPVRQVLHPHAHRHRLRRPRRHGLPYH